ncbi:hypothetical protein TWF481_002440 [Arthrobotrys musiformis]|uniref:Uncharacterized protein n=1 Tax=Arthrobotrys musiformis TaxID=47236 RepID=A0AAV9VV30_9PEZI
MQQSNAAVSAMVITTAGFLSGITLLYLKSILRGSQPGVVSRTMRRHPGVFGKKSVHWGKTTIIRNRSI